MQLGLVTYNWGKDWDLPTLLKTCAATGFGGVELRSTHKHGVEPTLSAQQRRDVAQQFADSPVELVGLGTACEYHAPDRAVVQKNIDETKAFIELCHDVGGSGVKVRPNGLPDGVPVEKTLEQIGRALRQVGEYGAGYGVEVRLEVHGRGTSSLPHIRTIMQVADHDNVRVCWNSNPTDLEGQGLEHNFRLVQPYLGRTVHIHDLISDYPWSKLFTLLKKARYDGWLLLEEGSPTADPLRVMKYYRKLFDYMIAAA
jgi:sugar phosphate isomerase/epimerase